MFSQVGVLVGPKTVFDQASTMNSAIYEPSEWRADPFHSDVDRFVLWPGSVGLMAERKESEGSVREETSSRFDLKPADISCED